MSIKTSSGDMNPILKANIDGQSYVGVALLRTGTLHLSDGSTCNLHVGTRRRYQMCDDVKHHTAHALIHGPMRSVRRDCIYCCVFGWGA